MLLVLVDQACGYDAEHERAQECHHKSRSYHAAAMLFVFATLSRSYLYITLFTVNVWFRLEHACDCLHDRFGCIC
jgi:hypothetical protein